MYDENDIPFNTYSLDFLAFVDFVYAKIVAGINFVNSGGATGVGGASGSVWSPGILFDTLSTIWGVMVVVSWLVSGLLIFGLIYAYIRHGQLGEASSEIIKRQEEAYAKYYLRDTKNTRWLDVQANMEKENPSNWKLAILESDILLGELLDKIGYAGNTIGEQLKSVSPESFQTINQAWRAHNVRNRIAHEGSDFELTKKIAKETVAQYKMVFDEFDFI